MKKYTFVILLFIVVCNTAKAQTVATDSSHLIDSAFLYLTGSFKQQNPQAAFLLFKQAALGGNAKAMNAVGMHYAKGLGVDTNFTLAAQWFTTAGANGYVKAWVNAGMLYKKTAGDSLGFATACYYFQQGVLQNEPSAYFALGYMKYKGLGCTQSYVDASTLFMQGAAAKRVDCMYFLGLCYKNGFGITQNTDSAAKYIQQAALGGYTQANAELGFVQQGTAARTANTYMPDKTKLPQKAQIVLPQISKTAKKLQIAGSYSGTMQVYDYSGKYTIACLPVQLRIDAANAVWTINNEPPFSTNTVLAGNVLAFKNTANAYGKATQHRLVFKAARFTIDTAGNNILTGVLSMADAYTNEPVKPIALQLKQAAGAAENNLQLAIHPNPVAGTECNITFYSTEKKATVTITNTAGSSVYAATYTLAQAGKQQLRIPVKKLSPGAWLLTVAAGNRTQTVKFIKN